MIHVIRSFVIGFRCGFKKRRGKRHLENGELDQAFVCYLRAIRRILR